MDEKYLKSQLQKKYDHSIWKELLTSIFPKVDYFSHPSILAEKTETAKSVRQIGNLSIADGNIGIFEVEVSSRKNIARNRVELRKIAASYIDQGIIHGAFVFYYASNQNDYRFTFIAKKSNFDEDGQLVKYQTPPKRYTYVLGPNESCTTAAKRLLELGKNEEVALDTIIQAFSIEKLTKEFFTKYKKEHYELFCNYLSNSPYRKSVFNIPHHKDKMENAKAEKPIRDFIKLLLGRIVFLHFLQKKGWLGCPADIEEWKDGDPKFMQNLFINFIDKKHFHSECLTELFFDTLNNHKRKNNIFSLTNTRVPYLNGGLFDNTHLEYNQIDFPQELFENLFDFFTQYNFTIDESSPDEHVVGIDPEMLGHIFENLLEDNKDKGAFYTPKEIVHYMCHESLIQYLKTNLIDGHPERREESQDIENFIHNQEVSQFIRDNAKEIDSLLDKVKICDPAIGSGAFPMGLLKEIFQAKIHLNPHIKPYRSFKMGDVKRNIIQNSIYGVDIGSGAVDIARLRFWLALIVDEEEPTPLPNLDYKIMQGNSLLESFEGIDLSTVTKPESFQIKVHNPQLRLDGSFEDGQTQIIFTDNEKNNLSELMKHYYNVSERKEKEKLHKQIDKIVLDSIHRILDRHRLNLESVLLEYKEKTKTFEKYGGKSGGQQIKKLRAKDYESIERLEEQIKEVDNKFEKLSELYSKSERPFFLWHLYFQDVFDNGGFDIVIGNPPYVRQEGLENKDHYSKNYQTFHGMADLYTYFFEKGFSILKHDGVLNFIVSNRFTHTNYGRPLRKYLSNKSIITIINFNGVEVFEETNVDSMIILLTNQKPSLKNVRICEIIEKYDFNFSLNKYLNNNSNVTSNVFFDENHWSFSNNNVQLLRKKIESLSTPLIKIPSLKINRGITTGLNEVFIINDLLYTSFILTDPKNRNILKPVLKGGDIKRWVVNNPNQYIIYSSTGIIIKDYQEIYTYLKLHKRELSEVWEAKNGSKEWYELRSCSYYDEFAKEKIIWTRLAKVNSFALSIGKEFCLDSAAFLTSDDNKYYLAILNSKVLLFYFKLISVIWGKEGIKWFGEGFDNLPIYMIDYSIVGERIIHDKIVELVNKILLAKQHCIDTKALEDEIDIIVYKLYNLTYEEVKIIDPNIGQIISKEEYEGFKIP